MTEQEQIKAIAELDGWVQVLEPLHHIHGNEKRMGRKTGGDWILLPDYLHSYDAIIPVIQKQNWQTQFRVREIVVSMRKELDGGIRVLNSTPTQLCEALLRATGKWKP